MDPFNTVNSALIFSGIYHSIKEIRLKMAVTRAIHALVVLSMMMPGASVMAAPSPGEDITQVVERPESSIPEL